MLEIDPLVVVAGITAMGGLLLFIVRLFLTGAVMPRSVVPREDYEALQAVNASYAEKFGQQTDVVRLLTGVVDSKLMAKPVARRQVARTT